mgnify:CR=1 FL=1
MLTAICIKGARGKCTGILYYIKHFLSTDIVKNVNIKVGDIVINRHESYNEKELYRILNNDYKSYSLNDYLILEPEQVQTYQLLFFINDIGIDQTSMDAGKNFGAGIKVSSIASGTYIPSTSP